MAAGGRRYSSVINPLHAVLLAGALPLFVADDLSNTVWRVSPVRQ